MGIQTCYLQHLVCLDQTKCKKTQAKLLKKWTFEDTRGFQKRTLRGPEGIPSPPQEQEGGGT